MTLTTPDTDTGNERFRPTSLGSYVGQIAMKRLIVTHLEAAVNTGGTFPHLLLVGPPGSGKTTLANIVANVVDLPLMALSTPPATKSTLAHMLLSMGDEGGVLFVDEIHEWTRGQRDQLLTVLEEGFFDAGWGRIECPDLTVIAATTEREKIHKPLLQRFTLRPAIEPYSELELAQIAGDMAVRADLTLSWDDCEAYGRAAGGVPRQVRTFIMHALALSASGGDASVAEVLEMAGVEADGLTRDHLDYLRRLLELDGEAGLTTLAYRLRLPESEVRDLERLLLDRDLVTLTKSGRRLRSKGHQRIKAHA